MLRLTKSTLQFQRSKYCFGYTNGTSSVESSLHTGAYNFHFQQFYICRSGCFPNSNCHFRSMKHVFRLWTMPYVHLNIKREKNKVKQSYLYGFVSRGQADHLHKYLQIRNILTDGRCKKQHCRVIYII